MVQQAIGDQLSAIRCVFLVESLQRQKARHHQAS
jgi:hypothetical protein